MKAFWKSVWVSVLLALVHLAQAACPTWPTTERFRFDGAEVTDLRTGLVWARCSVGQTWNGSTCQGDAIATFTHEGAFLYAKDLTGWRLPTRRELFSLADLGCYKPSIDAEAFPNTPSIRFWTSTPYVPAPASAWMVIFDEGVVFRVGRYFPAAIRLVRTSQ